LPFIIDNIFSGKIIVLLSEIENNKVDKEAAAIAAASFIVL
jgi:hypothetical protein